MRLDEYYLLPWACRRGDLAIDVGAHKGDWTAVLAIGFRKVHAIELGGGKCLPLDSLPIEGAVDFIKCDAEGAEADILRGATGLIRQHRPWLLLEVHSADSFLEVANLLAEWSYLITTIRDYLETPFSFRWYERCWISAQASEKCPRSHWMTAAE
jgi:Methyltransferase FkbM domain